MSTTTLPIRLLIADDHEMFRDGLSQFASKLPNVQLVGEASNGLELVRKAKHLLPDVILTDIKMPEMDGLSATRQLMLDLPSCYIISMSMFGDEHLLISMLEAGARGYLLKSAHKTQIEEAIRQVAKGHTYFCSASSERISEMIASKKYNPHLKMKRPKFSDKERDIIKLVCEGFVSKQISDQLGISVRTVEGYRERIQDKMDVRNTAGVVVYAIRYGIYPAV
ncbi:MAG: response regulator transcription factor [Chitinophagaceae bacterium]